ncbi:MAG: alpha/beta fold hydrolase [Flavobacteriales bacterium]|nr:alpha/beta fold hydrolase [Flavobacteriales bacterium]
MLLLTLPFAGGNETSYGFLRPFLPKGWEMVSMTQPGKGTRISEPPLTDIHAIVGCYLAQFDEMVKGPYAIYGHSMGAMLAYLLTHRLAETGRPLPQHLFLSSFPAPAHHHDRHRGTMTDEQFIAHMRTLGGLPPAVLDEPKLLRIILPMLRADIAAIDSYRYLDHEPLAVPITVMFGSQETALVSSVRDWQQESMFPLRLQRFDGGHFFIYPKAEEMMRFMGGAL